MYTHTHTHTHTHKHEKIFKMVEIVYTTLRLMWIMYFFPYIFDLPNFNRERNRLFQNLYFNIGHMLPHSISKI